MVTEDKYRCIATEGGDMNALNKCDTDRKEDSGAKDIVQYYFNQETRLATLRKTN